MGFRRGLLGLGVFARRGLGSGFGVWGEASGDNFDELPREFFQDYNGTKLTVLVLTCCGAEIHAASCSAGATLETKSQHDPK